MAATGVVAAGVLVAVSITDPVALLGPVAPPVWPALPLLPVVAILLAALPGVVTPLPPGMMSVAPMPVRSDRRAEGVAA